MRLRVIVIAAFALAGVIWLAGVLINHVVAPPTATGWEAASNEVVSTVAAPRPIRSATRSRESRSEDPVPPQVVVSWEQQRDGILTSNASSEEKANELLALVPQLAGADQEEATKHLINLLSDDHFFSAAAAYITNTAALTNVQALLITDLPNRPERVRLPLWLAIARTPDHPNAADALALLVQHLPEDHGTDWAAWEAAVDGRLRSSP